LPLSLIFDIRGLLTVIPEKLVLVNWIALVETLVPVVIEMFVEDCVKSKLATSVISRTAV